MSHVDLLTYIVLNINPDQRDDSPATMAHHYFKLINNRFLQNIISTRTIMYIRSAVGLYFEINSEKLISYFVKAYCVLLCAVSTIYVCMSPGFGIHKETYSMGIKLALLGIQLVFVCMSSMLVNNSENYNAIIESFNTIDTLIRDIDLSISRFLLVVDFAAAVIINIVYSSTAEI